MIDKTIHYCWFGGNPYPPLVEKCMRTWRKNLPDWQIVRWDETNAPIENAFVKKALDQKQYAFAADYVRFYALHEFGGVYLDTDVEVVKDLSPLLVNSSFAGSQSIGMNDVNAAIFAAEKGHPITKAIMRHFDVNINSKFAPIPEVINLLLEGSSFDISILPREAFYPYNPYDNSQDVKQLFASDITNDTYAIHHWMKSWTIPNMTKREKWCNSLRKRNPFVKK